MTDPDRTASRWRLSRWTLVGVVVGSVVVGVFLFGLMRAFSGTDEPAPAPAGVNPFGGIAVGSVEARARVDIYLDLQCPECRAYLDRVGPILDEMVAGGRAQVIYHPVAFLDRDSSTGYPTRAAAAAGCAAETGAYPALQRALFADLPPARGPGLSEQQLIDIGRQAGAGDRFADCVRDRRFEPWVSKMTSRAYNIGVKTVPTVLVDDDRIANTDQALRDAVAAAR